MFTTSARTKCPSSRICISISHFSTENQTRRLEVERKFCVTPSAVEYLRSNGQGSRFLAHQRLGKQTTHDIYYDRNTLLFSQGIYVRRRNGLWEAKVRTGGDFINSAFAEIEGEDSVKEVIQQNLTIVPTNANRIDDMVAPCADFVTERESWMIDGRFKVDVDITNFGHTVGEVELSTILPDGPEDQGRLRAQMDQEIQTFMKSCPQAFPAGRPQGKLSAYFQWRKQVQA